VVTLTGAALRAALEHSVSLLPAPAARFLQVSGLVVRFDPRRPAGRRVLAVEVGGRPLDPRRRYRVATTSFLARGGDGYTMLGEAPRVALDGPPQPIRDVVIDYVRRLGELPVPPADRLRAATR
jgi:2',3'-cyclic-nucleotide 2'-phosphodiesterase (5'-nucleotidase family)